MADPKATEVFAEATADEKCAREAVKMNPKTFASARLVAAAPDTMKPEHRELRMEKPEYRFVTV